MVSGKNSCNVEIEYCAQCRFILRASWMAQEILMTFGENITNLNLKPSSGGVFTISLDGEILFSRKQEGRFPESKEIKQLIRDRILPEMDLGHSDD
ncbi:MAG: SelT/SelW/SelH family protein [Gammaproteobacteria bacterium]|nr:MAG: SelT/SelW/SelH family protein [Gammaproteobacteria bacterium]